VTHLKRNAKYRVIEGMMYPKPMVLRVIRRLSLLAFKSPRTAGYSFLESAIKIT